MKLKKIQNYKTLIESFFSLSILNGLNVILPLITIPYLLRVVGVANYGVYSYVYVLIQYLLLICTYGFNYSATKQVAQNRDDNQILSLIYNSVFVCRVLLLVLAFFLFYFLSPIFLETETKKFMFLTGLGVVIGDILNPIWLFQGMEKMRYLTIVNLVSKLVFTIFIFLFIKSSEDYIYIILFNSCGFLLAGICSTFIAKKQFQISFFIPKMSNVTYQFKSGFALFGSAVGINLYKNANIFILNFFLSDFAVGMYATAEKIIKGFQLLGSPISQALFPYLGYNFKKTNISNNIALLKKATIPFSIILSLLSIIILLFAQPLVILISGEDYMEVVNLIRIMSPVILLGGLNSILGMSGLVNLNHQKTFFIGVILAGVFNVGFLLITVNALGVLSAAWSTTLSELVLLIVILSRISKISKIHKVIK